MITWSKFKSAVINAAGARILQVMGISLSTADECLPFGEDGQPLPNTIAIYAKTSNIAEPVILGYINKSQLAAAGEKRAYSLRPDGSLSFYTWLKNDGTMLIGGDTDNLVRYTPLETALMAQNAALNAELVKIVAAIATVGGTYAMSEVEINIGGSKIDEIKCL